MVQIVQMNKECAKWWLTNEAYDAFVSSVTGEMDKEHQKHYDNIVQLSLLCLMEHPIFGFIIKRGNEGCFLICWKVDDLEYTGFFHHTSFIRC